MIKDNFLHCDSCDERMRIATRKEIEEHENDPTHEIGLQPVLCNKWLKEESSAGENAQIK